MPSRRVIMVGVLVAIAALVILAVFQSDTLGRAFDGALAWAEGMIARHSTAGQIAFVTLSALSAMAAFLSSALLVPVATAAWGKLWTAVLLLIGWVIGGVAAYAIGRFLGRSVVRRLIPEKFEDYERRITRHTRWWMMFLFQLGMPSEVPEYLAGTVRYRFSGFVLALVVAELPYAAGAVLLGESFTQRNAPLFLAVAAISALFIVMTWRLMRRLKIRRA